MSLDDPLASSRGTSHYYSHNNGDGFSFQMFRMGVDFEGYGEVTPEDDADQPDHIEDTVYSLATEFEAAEDTTPDDDQGLDNDQVASFINNVFFDGSANESNGYINDIGAFVAMANTFEWDGVTIGDDGITAEELMYMLHIAFNAVVAPSAIDAETGQPVLQSGYFYTEHDDSSDSPTDPNRDDGWLTVSEAINDHGYHENKGREGYVGAHNIIGFVDAFGDGQESYNGEGLDGEAPVVVVPDDSDITSADVAGLEIRTTDRDYPTVTTQVGGSDETTE